MSLPTCPSCGQSVLEDDVVDCPFCGAAMDGSRGARNTPQPGKPGASRPGARKLPEKPAERPPVGTPAADNKTPAKAPAKPTPAGRPGSKLVVDEDDPFGIGAAGAGQAIQATLKPDKGRLQKVVCPMCEQTGFVPKTALGKSVRCANTQCMVPVFTAIDPALQKAERRPVRLSDEADALRRAAEANAPRKRNPLVVYGVAGAVLLGLAVVVVSVLKPGKPPAQLGAARDLSAFEQLAAEEEAARKAKADAEAAAKLVPTDDPGAETQSLIKRMINLARQDLRDKPMARRMTGDLWLKLGKDAEAATEFNQLAVVDKARGYYRVLPWVSAYWRAQQAGNAAAASAALQSAESELLQAGAAGEKALKQLPKSGRAITEACLALATALVHEGRINDAAMLVTSRQLDRSIPANRDTVASTAWLFIASQFRELTLNPPPAMDCCLWADPLHLSVAVNLAGRGYWKDAVAWTTAANDPRSAADALIAIADVGLQLRPPADAQSLLQQTASSLTNPLIQLRARAAVSVLSSDATLLQSCVQDLQQIPVIPAVAVPGTADLVRKTQLPTTEALPLALASAEVARAALLAAKPELAGPALTRCLEAFSAAAPPTTELRVLLSQATQQENAVRQQIQTDLRENNDSKLNAMFRDYGIRVGQLSAMAEDRRALMLLLLSRVVYAGGAAPLRELLNSSPDAAAEVQLDDTRYLLAVAAISTGQEFPEVMPGTADSPVVVPTTGVFAPLVAALGHYTGPAWATSSDAWAGAYVSLESSTDLVPGLRQAMMSDLTRTRVAAGDPAAALNSILQLKNGIWREEAMQVLGKAMTTRQQDKMLLEWVANNKLPAMEQICLFYGIAQGLLERPQSTPPQSVAPVPVKG